MRKSKLAKNRMSKEKISLANFKIGTVVKYLFSCHTHLPFLCVKRIADVTPARGGYLESLSKSEFSSCNFARFHPWYELIRARKRETNPINLSTRHFCVTNKREYISLMKDVWSEESSFSVAVNYPLALLFCQWRALKSINGRKTFNLVQGILFSLNY